MKWLKQLARDLFCFNHLSHGFSFVFANAERPALGTDSAVPAQAGKEKDLRLREYPSKLISCFINIVIRDSTHICYSPIAMLWGLAKLIGGRAPSGHRQSWWADGVPVMF